MATNLFTWKNICYLLNLATAIKKKSENKMSKIEHNIWTTIFHCRKIEIICLYFLSLQKEYFIGKFALQKQKDEGVTKRLVMFTLKNWRRWEDIWAWGQEPIYRNNKFVGTVTSAG